MFASSRKPHKAAKLEKPVVEEAIAGVLDALRTDSALKAAAIRKEVQDRISDQARTLCNAKDVKAATEAAHALDDYSSTGNRLRRRQRGA